MTDFSFINPITGLRGVRVIFLNRNEKFRFRDNPNAPIWEKVRISDNDCEKTFVHRLCDGHCKEISNSRFVFV